MVVAESLFTAFSGLRNELSDASSGLHNVASFVVCSSRWDGDCSSSIMLSARWRWLACFLGILSVVVATNSVKVLTRGRRTDGSSTAARSRDTAVVRSRSTEEQLVISNKTLSRVPRVVGMGVAVRVCVAARRGFGEPYLSANKILFDADTH